MSMKYRLKTNFIMVYLVLVICFLILQGDNRIWAFPSTSTLQLGLMRISSIQYSPDGKCLAVANGNSVLLLDAQTLVQRGILIGHPYGIDLIAISDNGRLLASASRNIIKLWSIQMTEEVVTLMGHPDWVRNVAFSPGEQKFLSVDDSGFIKAWDLKTAEEISTMRDPRFYSQPTVFSPDGQIIAMANVIDETIHLLDVQTGKQLNILKWRQPLSMVFSPDGLLLASGNYNGVIQLWNVQTGKEFKILRGQKGGARHLAFSPDGLLLASAGDDVATITLWEVQTGNMLRTLTGHTEGVTSLAFSPDGKTLVSGGGFIGGELKLWDVKQGFSLSLLLPSV